MAKTVSTGRKVKIRRMAKAEIEVLANAVGFLANDVRRTLENPFWFGEKLAKVAFLSQSLHGMIELYLELVHAELVPPAQPRPAKRTRPRK